MDSYNNPLKTLLPTCFIVPLLALSNPAAAVVDGSYNLMINTTPSSGGQYVAGSDGAWNSTMAWGDLPGAGYTTGMTDNDAQVTGSDGTSRGSGIAGDGYAGVIGMTITGGAISVGSFNVDTMFDSPLGSFAQYAYDTGLMTGSVDATGNMVFTPTGRLAASSAPSTLYDLPWNIDDVDGYTSNGNTDYSYFTTGTHTGASSGNISGSAFTSIGDINADGLLDYIGILVSAGEIGTAWGCCTGAIYYETWNVTLLSQVPVPAAAWLFGSGLLGLVGLARRRA